MNTEQLLRTKLNHPHSPDGIVVRSRLIDQLNSAASSKLILVSAPAGFGKTTLLSEWMESYARPVAWLSLDEGDNDPVRFLAYLIAALRTVQPELSSELLDMFKTPNPPPMQSALTALINQIIETKDTFILVLDDYHEISSQPVHDMMAFFLEHLPDSVRVIITTRMDPPLPVARLRGKGQLAELRAADLRFTPDEIALFLSRFTGQTFSAGDIDALAARTEGWIAGLKMAAVSLRGRDDVEKYIRAFTGSNRYILDYLVEEVLKRQPQDIQSFLLDTSILKRLSGPLCDAVCARTDSQAILEYIEKANLFIVPLDSERKWYRYHHLLTDLLRQRLAQADPQRITALHANAGRWYEQNGYIDEAVEHAFLAGSHREASGLILSHIEEIMARSELVTLLRWIDSLPEEIVRAQPLLCAYHALAMLLTGCPAEEVAARLDDAGKADVKAEYAGEIATFRAWCTGMSGDFKKLREQGEAVLKLLPKDRLMFRCFAYLILGAAHMMAGEVNDAIRVFEEAVKTGRAAGNTMVVVLACVRLASLYIITGRLHQAQEHYHEVLEYIDSKSNRRPPVAGIALIGLGGLLYELNDMEAAEAMLRDGIKLVKKWGEIGAMSGYMTLAMIKQDTGDSAAANELILQAVRVAYNFKSSIMDDVFARAYQARLWIQQGNMDAAHTWVCQQGLESKIVPEELEDLSENYFLYYVREVELTTLARLQLAQGDYGQALSLLNILAAIAEKQGRTGSLIELLVLKAAASKGSGDSSSALEYMVKALTLAEPSGYMRTFISEGCPAAELLHEIQRSGIMPAYTAKLLAAFSSPSVRPQAADNTAPALPEPLSERELEVLGLMSRGYSNQEIASTLFISLRTVKWHTGNIYDKLNTHGWTRAVLRARALGILPAS